MERNGTSAFKVTSGVSTAVLVGASLVLGGLGGSTLAIALSGDRAAETGPSERSTLEVFGELSAEPGFVGGGPGDGAGVLEVLWAGDPGPEAESVIGDAAARGIRVEVTTVRHAPEELWAAAVELAGALEDAGMAVWGFGPDRAHEVIEVMGPQLSVDPELQRDAREIAATVLGSEFRVEFVPNESGSVNYVAHG